MTGLGKDGQRTKRKAENKLFKEELGSLYSLLNIKVIKPRRLKRAEHTLRRGAEKNVQKIGDKKCTENFLCK